MVAAVLGSRHSSTYLANHLGIGSPGTIVGCDCLYDTDYISLHHAHIIRVSILLSHLKEVLDEVHDVGTCVHVVLRRASWSASQRGGARLLRPGGGASVCKRGRECSP